MTKANMFLISFCLHNQEPNKFIKMLTQNRIIYYQDYTLVISTLMDFLIYLLRFNTKMGVQFPMYYLTKKCRNIKVQLQD